ncbi:MAG TPA: hypothetical protein ENK62_01885 [Chromatiales bacterium]|nr:hypothetical protein [Chromatiales bacterium]
MGFDSRKFLNTEFRPRTEEVRVPDLAPFFDGEPVWVVRGLTGHELARVNAAAEAARSMEALAEALAAQAPAEKAEALKQLLGLGEDTPEDLARRIEMLRLGSVEPECDRELAVKLADAYPVEFYQLTNAISRLTGMGKLPGEPSGSGATPASEPH